MPELPKSITDALDIPDIDLEERLMSGDRLGPETDYVFALRMGFDVRMVGMTGKGHLFSRMHGRTTTEILPPYTTSVDAAQRAIPEGYSICQLSQFWKVKGETIAPGDKWVLTLRKIEKDRVIDTEAFGGTMAAALCNAILGTVED